jgi:hypothetical protein
MKKACLIACALLFVSIAAFAQTPSQAPLTHEALVTILGESAATGSCATPTVKAPFDAPPPAQALATCPGVTFQEQSCCRCSQTNDCFDCCICSGGSIFACARCA